MFKSLTLFFLILLSQFSLGQTDAELAKDQQKIVAHLSGHTPLENGKIIASRSTKEERQLAREYLASLLSSLGLKAQLQDYKLPNVNPVVDLLLDPFQGANVYTILPATAPSDKYIVLGAHFDTERNCPGAIDNATGIAIGFGALKKLVALDHRKLNVILVFFDQEEEDLVGSQAFAQKLKKEKFKVLSVHTMDTMGWDRDGDKAIELELPSTDLKEIYIKKGQQLGIPIYITKVNSTDHHSFRELGFNAAGLTDELLNGDYAPYKDTAKDTYETVNFDYVTSCTSLVFEVVKELIQ